MSPKLSVEQLLQRLVTKGSYLPILIGMEAEATEEFQELTNCSKELAVKYLVRNRWNLNYALNEYYDQEIGTFTSVSVPTPVYPTSLVELFQRYCGRDQTVMGTDALLTFIHDLGYESDDIVTLCLTKLLRCRNLFEEITGDQFLESWYNEGCSHLSQMQEVMKSLEIKLCTDKDYFTEIYDYTFAFLLDTNSRALDTATAIGYWDLFLDNKHAIYVDPNFLSLWKEFLQVEKKETINKDCWHMILEFFKQFPTIALAVAEYKEDDAWPYIIDEFQEYVKSKL